MLECGEGAGANIAKGGDLITKNLDEDWTGGWVWYIQYIWICTKMNILILVSSTDCANLNYGLAEDPVAPGY